MSANPQRARVRTSRMIEDMLDERKEMLVLFWDLSGVGDKVHTTSVRETLDEFLGLLVDYIAAGHFGLYERISEGKERRKAVMDVARDIYPRIAESTDVAVDFSEKYEKADERLLIQSLAKDLSRLGEEIAARIELEDRLILAMLGESFEIPAIARSVSRPTSAAG